MALKHALRLNISPLAPLRSLQMQSNLKCNEKLLIITNVKQPIKCNERDLSWMYSLQYTEESK